MNLPNFWETFPDSLLIDDFSYLKNKSTEDKANRLMWYVHLIHNPENEFVHKLPKKDREEKIMSFCGVKKADLKLDSFIRAQNWYTENWISPAAKSVVILGDRIKEANSVMLRTIDSLEQIEEYTKAIRGIKILKTEYDDFCDMFKQERKSKMKQYGKDTPAGPAADGSLFD